MPRLHETPMGRRFFQNTMPKLAKNLDRIATQMEEESDGGPDTVFVLVGIHQGVIDDVTVTPSHDKAILIERDLCAKYGVPADPEEREKYCANNPNEVRRFEVELE